MDVCPENCLRLVPLSQFAFTGETKTRLAAEAGSRDIDLQHVAAEELGAAEGSVMVKDESVCIRCGLCAERCPVHTITMEAFEVVDHDPDLVSIEEMVLRP